MNTNIIPPKRGRRPFEPGQCRERIAARVKKSTYEYLMGQIAQLPGEGKEKNLGRFLDKMVDELSSTTQL